MQLRYETLASFDQGSQGACPGRFFEFLREVYHIQHECFASSLNISNSNGPDQTFNSLFHDVDKYFGAQTGSFFQFFPESGAYEANPPFDEESVNATFRCATERQLALTNSLHVVVIAFAIIENELSCLMPCAGTSTWCSSTRLADG